MRKLYRFPSINQFRSIVQAVERKYKFKFDEDAQDYVFDQSAKAPTLTFTGTVKLHGTNSGIAFTPDNDMYPQSKGNVISPVKDNAGFAGWLSSTKVTEAMTKMRDELRVEYGDDLINWLIQKGFVE